MKFCLWVPPKRYLSWRMRWRADLDGVSNVASKLTEKFLEPLRGEFREFFRHDRNTRLSSFAA